MIATMDQMLIVGRRSLAKDVLVSLQNLGVLHIDALEPGEDGPLARVKLKGEELEHKELWDYLVAKSEAILGELKVGAEVVPAGRSDVSNDPAALHAQLEPLAQQVESLIAERADIRDELDVASTYLPIFRLIAPTLAQLDDSYFLAGVPFLVPEDGVTALEESFNADEHVRGRFLLSSRPYRKERLIVAAVLAKDLEAFRAALTRAGASPITLPDRYADDGVARAAHVMEERSQVLPKRLTAIDSELKDIATKHGARLLAISQAAANQQARYHRLTDMAEGRYGFALQGWVPSDQRDDVVASLQKHYGDDIVVESRVANEHHDKDVPVKLDNAAWVRPFEGLLALFAPPKYGSFDPSWTLAIFFPLYFGIVVGDIGFGLLFGTLAWWLRGRGRAGKSVGLGPLGITLTPRVLAPVSTVIYWCAAWSIVWGFVYGEFFGNLLERFPAARPIFYTTLHHEAGHGLINIWLFRVEQFTPLLLLCIGFGVLQVLGGWLIRVIFGIRHGDMKHVYEGIGMFSGILAAVVFATAYLTSNLNPVVLGIVVVGLVVFLVCAALAKMPLMIIELVSNSGHILSYLRLFAVGLAAAIVAGLATSLGYAIGGTLPVLGPILGILVAFAVQMTALVLTIIGHALQPLRLQYVEFFTKFGYYDENGRAYRPFKLLGGK